jgi:hypothetical protein
MSGSTWITGVPSRLEVARAIESVYRAERSKAWLIVMSARSVEDNLPRQYQHAPLTDSQIETKKRLAFEVASRFAEAELAIYGAGTKLTTETPVSY